MADILVLLGKVNVVIAAAIVVVFLLRRPLRRLFGASIAYTIWLVVPIAVLASLMPPRVIVSSPTHLARTHYAVGPISVIRRIADPSLRITEQLTGQIARPVMHITEQLARQGALAHSMIAERRTASDYWMPDHAMLLYVIWVLGMVLMASYLTRLQARFEAAVRLGEAGPAVLGFLRPHIVFPDSFQEQFTAAEWRAILAHERVHLARQDARINGLAALLRCLCWFNPLIHLGTTWLRIDQELACDAAAVTGPVSRGAYANALLKSQMMVAAALPAGCNWPGSQHPLIERIKLLKRKHPGRARRITGTGFVILAATSAGVGAWAAQPPVATKFIAGQPRDGQIALAKLPAMTTARSADAAYAGLDKPGTSAIRAGSNDKLPSHAHRLLVAGNIVAPWPDLLRLSKEMLATTHLIGSSDPPSTSSLAIAPAAPAKAATTQAPTAQTCALPAIEDTAPLEQFSGTGLMTVPVAENGTTKQFLLDLAINKPTEASPASMAKLGLPLDPKQTELLQFGLSGGPAYRARSDINVPIHDVRDNAGASSLDTRARVGSFGMSDATDRGLEMIAAGPGEMIEQSKPYASFLNGDLFKQYDVDLDFAGRQMTWLTPTECTDPNQVVFWPHSEVAVIPVTLAHDGRLQMQAIVRGRIVNAELDTTSPRTVMRRDVAELHVGLHAKDMRPAGDLKDGMNMQIYVATFPEIVFAGGGVTAKNVPVLIQDYSMIPVLYRTSATGSRTDIANERIPDLVIGMDVLEQLHLYVVPTQGRVYVTSAH